MSIITTEDLRTPKRGRKTRTLPDCSPKGIDKITSLFIVKQIMYYLILYIFKYK